MTMIFVSVLGLVLAAGLGVLLLSLAADSFVGHSGSDFPEA